MEEQDPTQLIVYRIEVLEKQYSNILKLVQETHDAVTTIRAKMGENPFQCNVHVEKMTTYEKRLADMELYQAEMEKEGKELKKWVYKVAGGLTVISILFSTIIAPTVLKELNKPHIVQFPGGTNNFTIK
jgi:hypothetical protein